MCNMPYHLLFPSMLECRVSHLEHMYFSQNLHIPVTLHLPSQAHDTQNSNH